MYGNMYGYNPIQRIDKQIEELTAMRTQFQNVPAPQPVNNIINTNQPQNTPRDLIELRVLNEKDEVDNLYVNNKTLFIGQNRMVIKGVDGSLEKWNIEKTYPIDEKDKKIKELEQQIKELKEAISNGYKQTTKSDGGVVKSDVTVDECSKPAVKTASKPVSKQE